LKVFCVRRGVWYYRRLACSRLPYSNSNLKKRRVEPVPNAGEIVSWKRKNIKAKGRG
jgi:hypothetical protein